jgi:transcriptional regulator with XRE-family HTH domain
MTYNQPYSPSPECAQAIEAIADKAVDGVHRMCWMVGIIVHHRRQDMGLTVEQLEQRSGVSREILYGLLRGKNKSANLKTLINLLDAVDMTLHVYPEYKGVPLFFGHAPQKIDKKIKQIDKKT